MSNLPEKESMSNLVYNDNGESSCTSEPFSSTDKLRKLNIVFEDVKSIQDRIKEFSGIDEDHSVFYNIEDSLYECLIALNAIPTDLKEEVNQKKHEVVSLIQNQLQDLHLKLQDNQQKGVNPVLFAKNGNSNRDGSAKSSVETPRNLEVIEEMEEYSFVLGSSNTPLEPAETYKGPELDELALRVLNCSIKESSLGYLKSLVCDVPCASGSRSIRLKTVPVPDSLNCNRKRDNYKKSANKRTINQALINKCILPENVFRGLFQAAKNCGNAILGFIFPVIEMGNRLALKRIQLVLLHIRFLLMFLILELPIMTAVVFYGLYTMPDMHQIE